MASLIQNQTMEAIHVIRPNYAWPMGWMPHLYVMKKKLRTLVFIVAAILFFCIGALFGLILNEKLKESENCISVTFIDPGGSSFEALYFIRGIERNEDFLNFQIRQNAFIMDGLALKMKLNRNTSELSVVGTHLPLSKKSLWTGRSHIAAEEVQHIDCLLRFSGSEKNLRSSEYLKIKCNYSSNGMGDIKWKLLSFYDQVINRS